MEIQIRVLHPDAVIPHDAHRGDGGWDVSAVEDCVIRAGGGRAVVATGIAVAIPEGYGGFVLPRSGLATHHGVTCVNAPGLIDSGYRGEVKVALVNLDPERDYEIRKGDRIAQLVVLPVSAPRFRVVDELGESSRASAGFGSTGR